MIDLNLVFSNDDLFLKHIYFEEIDLQRLLDKIEKSNFKDKDLSLKLLGKLIDNYSLL
ncbi:MAG: hypothetical protein ACRC1T_10815 [Clostridium chrysemydis]|uniref:hypothetical protein n=1 Tax=Clostridium TaxID=1485 RepID=UPI002152414A|nr:hypothetical protein [Clostridium sp. LY3-2]MCR6514297.1 hypothetical protein [Clostridium sp. LY3-2]